MNCPWKWSNIDLQFRTLRPGGGGSGVEGFWMVRRLGNGAIYRGFPGYLTLYRCFITIYLFTPLKSKQKRFCYHLDLPTHKTHGFAYHILLYLTYFRFCVLGVLQQKLDHLQFSEVQTMPPIGNRD